MTTFLIILLLISSFALIITILLQPGKSAGLSGSIAGGAESLFGKKRAKGYEAILSRITTISAVVFMLSALLLTAFQ
ncbi:preprotein translocase subunit SecG [Garciella nitratireducens]|uniref:Protein-export membrane protein SecG n=1 Tax=Garciella nitratireducens DSM 15102 TaxID=1121911 RepID=A0A1T4KLI8_9FIRM|nr:preprotein translocase subunit SecG [Garciella nitratireducens]RBP41610.1 preprotein translocase subunit SecG [Garciella nitratireducens]SJZ43302.1 preprotein translocase subunit SecG [Garciella nitratireducens DSM 15102]